MWASGLKRAGVQNLSFAAEACVPACPESFDPVILKAAPIPLWVSAQWPRGLKNLTYSSRT